MFCCCCCCCNIKERDTNTERNSPTQINSTITFNICCCSNNTDYFCCCCCCCRNLNQAERLSYLPGTGNSLCSCCSYIAEKIYQILYIICNICILISLITMFAIINWDKFPKINLTLFIIILIIVFTCLFLTILLYCFTIQIPTNSQILSSINHVKIIGFILTIICLIFCVIEEIFLSLNISQVKDIYSCNYSITNDIGFFFYKKDNYNNRKVNTIQKYSCYEEFITPAIYGLSYFTLTFIEIIYCIGCFFWFIGRDSCCNFNNKIYQNNQPVNIIPRTNVPNPQVIIVNQENIVNNPIIPNNNYYPEQPNSNGNYVYNENYVYSNRQNPYPLEQNQVLNSNGGLIQNIKNKVKNFIIGN